MDNKIKKFRLKIKNAEGFTLIELLIVIAIIGILSTVLMVNFIGIRERARDARRKSDLRQIQQAVELYKADAGLYPQTSDLDGKCNSPFTSSDGKTTYMSKVPQDPDGVHCYYYRNPGYNNTPYTLFTCLENTNDNDQHNVTGDSNYSVCGVNKAFVLTSDQ